MKRRGPAHACQRKGGAHHATKPFKRPRSGWLAVAAFACAPSAAGAACQIWDVSRGFNAIQENGYTVVFKLGALHEGQAKGSAYYHTGSDFRRVNGTAHLSFYKDDHFEINAILASLPDKEIGLPRRLPEYARPE